MTEPVKNTEPAKENKPDETSWQAQTSRPELTRSDLIPFLRWDAGAEYATNGQFRLVLALQPKKPCAIWLPKIGILPPIPIGLCPRIEGGAAVNEDTQFVAGGAVLRLGVEHAALNFDAMADFIRSEDGGDVGGHLGLGGELVLSRKHDLHLIFRYVPKFAEFALDDPNKAHRLTLSIGTTF